MRPFTHPTFPMLFGLLLAGAVSSPAHGAKLPAIDDGVRTGATSPEDAAVVVGIERYYDLPHVTFAESDADAFWNFLLNTRGVPGTHIERLPAHPTEEAIREAVQEAAKNVGEDGILWFYFAGHATGWQLEDELGNKKEPERVLLCADAQRDARSFATRSLPVEELKAVALSSPASQVVVVLDACYSGYSRDGSAVADDRGFTPVSHIQAQDRIVEWTATTAKETAIPYTEAGHGLFTYYLIGALSGWADGFEGEPDDKVTFDEVARYVSHATDTVSRGAQHATMQSRPDLIDWVVVESPELMEGPSLSSVPPAKPVMLPEQDTTDAITEVQRRSDAIRTKAVQEWGDLVQYSRTGRAEGKILLQKFIEKYDGAYILYDGDTYPVDVPEVSQATQIYSDYEIYWKKRRHRQAGAVLSISGGIAASAGFILAGSQYQGMQECAQGYCPHLDFYKGWIGAGVAMGITGTALISAGVINLAIGSSKSKNTAFVPGPVTYFYIKF